MKKCIFTLVALMLVSLGAHAYNYNSVGPSNEFGGRSLFPTAPTAGGSEQAYRDMVNASYYNNNYNHSYYRKPVKPPRKPRQHGSAANKPKE